MPDSARPPSSWWDAGWIEKRSIRAGLDQAAPQIRGVVLDAGCGDGRHRAFLEAHGGTYVGVDAAPGSAAAVRADVTRLPFRDESFDTVVSVQVLDDLKEPERFFASARRVLRPGGHLVLTAPFFWRVHDLPHDYFRFTGPGLAMLATGNGFEVASLEPRGGFWATGGQSTSLYFWGLLGRGPLKPLATALCVLIQSLALLLEAVHSDTRQTLGYTLVARKRADR